MSRCHRGPPWFDAHNVVDDAGDDPVAEHGNLPRKDCVWRFHMGIGNIRLGAETACMFTAVARFAAAEFANPEAHAPTGEIVERCSKPATRTVRSIVFDVWSARGSDASGAVRGLSAAGCLHRT